MELTSFDSLNLSSRLMLMPHLLKHMFNTKLINMHAMLILNSPTMHNINTKFTNNEICKTIKCAHIQMHSKKANNWNPCVSMYCALCTMHLKIAMSCAQCWHRIVSMHSMLILNSHIMQSVHTIRCTQRKQSSWNPSMSMHYAFKDSNELCTMLMSSSLTKKFTMLQSIQYAHLHSNK